MVETEQTDVAIVGGGPAGLTAAITAARSGASVVLLDENSRAGGQLFKQIHKFFGSAEHYAGVRGFSIGEKLLQEAEKNGVEIWLNSVVYGIFKDKLLAVAKGTDSHFLTPEKIVFANGASENIINFPGWTLPGVMGAGAVQTLVNVQRVLPGRRFLIVGAGNVGVIVAYQLLQAGAKIVAVVEALPRVGGYFVHAAKIRRAGVPILTSHTVKEVYGKNEVEGARIVALDKKWKPISATEKTLRVDTVCLAVGLSPSIELPLLAGCRVMHIPELGGRVPVHSENMETTQRGIYVAGDAAGIEEASSAMEEGRMAGISAAESLGYIESHEANEIRTQIGDRLRGLRMGPFGESRHSAKQRLNLEARRLT